MTTLAPRYSAEIDFDRRELHFTTSGLFDFEAMKGLQAEIGKAVAPFIARRIKFRAFGDLSDYVVQKREISDGMSALLQNAEKAGIERVAMLITSTLVHMQYQRVSETSGARIFDNKTEALEWLRSD